MTLYNSTYIHACLHVLVWTKCMRNLYEHLLLLSCMLVVETFLNGETVEWTQRPCVEEKQLTCYLPGEREMPCPTWEMQGRTVFPPVREAALPSFLIRSLDLGPRQCRAKCNCFHRRQTTLPSYTEVGVVSTEEGHCMNKVICSRKKMDRIPPFVAWSLHSLIPHISVLCTFGFWCFCDSILICKWVPEVCILCTCISVQCPITSSSGVLSMHCSCL